MTQLLTLGRTELMEALGDYLAKKAGAAVRIRGLTTVVSLDADPAAPSLQVEFEPTQAASESPISFAVDPTERLP